MLEATGRDLLNQPLAWPLARRLRVRQRFSTARLPLVDHSLRIDHFAYFEAHDFQPDKLSEGVAKRNEFEQTYARPMRPKTDNELPGDVLEAIQYNHMPQFNLRNIGRAERSAEPDDPLPFARAKGLGGDFGVELDQVREAEVPKVQWAQVWSVAFVRRVRNSLRRLVVEDPWEHRFGAEATSVHSGLRHSFVVEGTHPDDMPGSWWGPEPLPAPERWLSPPPGEEPMERPMSMSDTLAALAQASKDLE